MNILGKRIKTLRENNKISQKDFAKLINVSNVVLSRYETGERKPDYDTLLTIAKYFGVTTDYLLGNSNDPNLTEKESFEAFINDPELRRWHRELPKSKEEDLARLKRIWEAYKDE